MARIKKIIGAIVMIGIMIAIFLWNHPWNRSSLAILLVLLCTGGCLMAIGFTLRSMSRDADKTAKKVIRVLSVVFLLFGYFGCLSFNIQLEDSDLPQAIVVNSLTGSVVSNPSPSSVFFVLPGIQHIVWIEKE